MGWFGGNIEDNYYYIVFFLIVLRKFFFLFFLGGVGDSFMYMCMYNIFYCRL